MFYASREASTNPSGNLFVSKSSISIPDGRELQIGDFIITPSANVYQAGGTTGPGGASIIMSHIAALAGNDGKDGADGEPGLNWRGEWSRQEDYVKNDVVYRLGSAYVCLSDSMTNSGADMSMTPPENNPFWSLLVSKGDTGADGVTPVKGTDYFTEADKAEIVSAVIAALPVYAGEVV